MESKLKNIGLYVRDSLNQLIIKYPNEFTEDYGCLCAISSILTSKILDKLSIDNKVYLYENEITLLYHSFNQIDKFILDCTASQFKEYKKYDVLLIDKNYYLFWEPGFIKQVKSLRSFSSWPKYQKPSTHQKLIKTIVEKYNG